MLAREYKREDIGRCTLPPESQNSASPNALTARTFRILNEKVSKRTNGSYEMSRMGCKY